MLKTYVNWAIWIAISRVLWWTMRWRHFAAMLALETTSFCWLITRQTTKKQLTETCFEIICLWRAIQLCLTRCSFRYIPSRRPTTRSLSTLAPPVTPTTSNHSTRFTSIRFQQAVTDWEQRRFTDVCDEFHRWHMQRPIQSNPSAWDNVIQSLAALGCCGMLCCAWFSNSIPPKSWPRTTSATWTSTLPSVLPSNVSCVRTYSRCKR